MSKHTKGPWLIARCVPKTFVYALNPQGYNQFWADVKGGNTAPMESTTDEELEANARLISAAPDLLEALKALTHSLDQSDLLHDDQRAAFKTSIQAIAKATGGQA